MKQWFVLVILVVIITTMFTPNLADAKKLPVCPVCGLHGVKTGQANYQYNKLLVQYRCAYNHTWWEQE